MKRLSVSFVQDVQAVPGAGQAGITADDADIRFHDLVHFFHALGDQYAFFGGIVPSSFHSGMSVLKS